MLEFDEYAHSARLIYGVQVGLKQADSPWDHRLSLAIRGAPKKQSQIASRLKDLMSLENGWDGPDSVPASKENADFALSVTRELFREKVPAPSIFPIGDGTLQIEWHCSGYEVELDVVAPNDINAGRLHISSGDEDDINVAGDLAILSSWIDDLAADKDHIHKDG